MLRARSMYNISVMDYLLKAEDARADSIVKGLTAFGEDEQQFLDAYVAGGTQQEALVRRLSAGWNQAFVFIVSRSDIADPDKIRYLNAALEDSIESVDYVVERAVSAFVEKHFAQIAVFTSESTSAELASRAISLLVAGNARLETLAPLGTEVRRVAVHENRYLITRDNLVAALDGAEGLALDEIRDRNQAVYGYVVRHLPEYLAAIRETDASSHAIEAPDAFAAVISDVVQQSPSLLPDVLAAAASNCQLARLTDVPDTAWPALADSHRFPTTFENVTVYIETIGELDEHLASLLENMARIELLDAVEESEKALLGYQILAAREVLPAPTIRIELVGSLELKDWLKTSIVQPEHGQLIGLLIERELIEDNSQSFALTLEADWGTREFAISKSRQFWSYMTPTEVPVGDVASLMESSLVPHSVKETLLERIDEFVPTDNRNALTAIAKHADSRNVRLKIELVTRMATTEIDSELVLRLLEPLLSEVMESQLVEVLKAIGGVYETVSERNGRRPKLPNTAPNLALLRRLEKLGVVSTYQEGGNEITANMKKG